MRYGIEIGAVGECGDPRTLAELAHVAEESGWDGIFLEDYIVHWSGGPTYDPWMGLASMALDTKRIRLGTTVTPLARRRPWKVASETVTLDHLSGGRLILGVGLGAAQSVDIANFGEVSDNRQRGSVLDEALDVLAELWSGELFGYQGEHFQVQEIAFAPKPVQSPRIPIWVGGGYPNAGALRRAERWDGAVMYKQPPKGVVWVDMTPEDVRGLKAYVEEQRGAGVDYEIAIGGRGLGPDREAERAYLEALVEAGATWWMEGIAPGKLAEVSDVIARGAAARLIG